MRASARPTRSAWAGRGTLSPVTSDLALQVNGSAAAVPANYGLAERPDGAGNVDLFLTTAAVPEPTGLSLVAAAAGPLALARRRRRHG